MQFGIITILVNIEEVKKGNTDNWCRAIRLSNRLLGIQCNYRYLWRLLPYEFIFMISIRYFSSHDTLIRFRLTVWIIKVIFYTVIIWSSVHIYLWNYRMDFRLAFLYGLTIRSILMINRKLPYETSYSGIIRYSELLQIILPD